MKQLLCDKCSKILGLKYSRMVLHQPFSIFNAIFLDSEDIHFCKNCLLEFKKWLEE